MNAHGRRWLFAVFLAATATAFLSLGVWQVQRRAWKHALIERVQDGLRATPQELSATVFQASPAARFGQNTAAPTMPEYRRVHLHGQYLPTPGILVQAATILGSGYWLMAPLQCDDGTVVLINRGFVPARWRTAPLLPPAGPVHVVGLLRVSQPHEAWLRHNEPAQNRWVTRSVPDLAKALGLSQVAPFFVDAGDPTRAPDPNALQEPAHPVEGLTQVQFSDNHLLYALTWFGLSALSLVGLYLLLKKPHSSSPLAPGK